VTRRRSRRSIRISEAPPRRSPGWPCGGHGAIPEDRDEAARRWRARSLRAQQLVGGIGSAVTFEALPAELGGFYEPRTRRIVVNHCRSVNGQAATLIHELAHALVRCDRQPEDPALSYAEEELVVESVAYTVCGACGLDVAGAAVPYLASLAEQAELETIEQTAKLIDRLARRIEAPLLTAASVTEVPEAQADEAA
jgi:hypothetical protein